MKNNLKKEGRRLIELRKRLSGFDINLREYRTRQDWEDVRSERVAWIKAIDSEYNRVIAKYKDLGAVR